MKFLDILKQLKMIEPDATYAENSKRAILSSPVLEKSTGPFGVRRVVIHILETAFAAGLAVLFIVFITGGFSGTGLSPAAPFAAVDPSTLKAEAQAVNMQIKLADLAYTYEAATTT